MSTLTNIDKCQFCCHCHRFVNGHRLVDRIEIYQVDILGVMFSTASMKLHLARKKMHRLNQVAVAGLICLACWSGGVNAQEKLDATAQVRYRFQTDGRDFDKATSNFSFSQLRSRLGLNFVAGENLTLFLMLQDSRIMGEEASTLTDGTGDALDMREGFMKVTEFLWNPLDMKLGRMRIKYGEERLVGYVDWHNIGRSFDGVVFTVHDSWFSADVFAFAQVEGLVFEEVGDLNVLGINWDVFKGEQHTNEAYLVWQLASPSNELNRWTAGYYINGKLGGFEYTSNGAYQGGELTPDSLKQDVQAYMLTLDLWYRFPNAPGRLGVSAGVDFLSGDGNPDDLDYKVFDTLYATNHKFYGFMDYFLNIPRDTSLRGLVDSYARVLVHLGSVPARVDFHLFQSAEDFPLQNGATSRDFGFEIDVTLKHVYDENLTFLLGGSMFEPGDIFKDTRGSDIANWAYIMVIANI